MENKERFAEFHVQKSELTGRPVVKAVVPKGSEFKDLVRVQEILYTDILEKIGLGAHDNCLSGLDGFILQEQFEDIIRVGF
jgi:hypothetical protein